MIVNMFLLTVIGIGLYAYRLFSWSDIMPLSMDDIIYMIPFAVEHVIYTVLG